MTGLNRLAALRHGLALAKRPPSLKLPPQGGHVGLGGGTAQRNVHGYWFSKNGGKPGGQAWLEHLPSGIDFAILFNTSLPKNGPNPLPEARKLLCSAFHEILGVPG